MNTRPDVTLHSIALDLDQTADALKFFYQLVERLETDYFLTLKQHQQQSLPGIPKTPTNDLPFDDPMPF